MIRRLASLLRSASAALFPADEMNCQGCFLDAQWVGSLAADHSCARCGPR